MKTYSYIQGLILLTSILFITGSANNSLIIDSNMTFNEAIKGTEAPKEVIGNLVLLDVEYFSTDGECHKGQLIIHKSVEKDIREIFQMIKKIRFPVEKVIPIVKYNWSDNESMKDNNTSAFNYRFIAGTERLSMHSYGRAIDINPFFNPVVYPDGRTSPGGAKYEVEKPGTFTEQHPIVLEFLKRGWRWGKNFSKYDDNHHFDKEK